MAEKELVPAYGSTWKLYWASLDEVLTEEDICEMLGTVKAEKHYQGSQIALVTPTLTNNAGE